MTTSTRGISPLLLVLLATTACGGGGAGSASTPVAVVPPSATPVSAPAPTPSASPTPLPSPTAAPVAAPTPTPAVLTPAPIASGYKRVVYVGNDVPDLFAYEKWLGRSSDGIQLHTGRAGWSDWSTSLPWLIDRWKGVDRTIYWSIPLFAEGGTLEDASAGVYNGYYKAAAQKLAAAYPGAKIYVRTGWEFNGTWQPWAAKGKEAAYRGAFRQFVAAFRLVSDRFIFEWCPNNGDFGTNPEDSYPGDDVVDIVGMDFYYDHQWDNADPVAAWTYKLNERYGLAWHQAFARAHGKRTAYAEWGVSGNGDGPFVALAAAWFASHDVVYASYWNSNAAFPGKLSDGQYPAVTAAYRLLAGQ